MADNVTLNSGSGGAEIRTLDTAGGVEWPASVVAYATTLSAGANVLQVVTPSNGLPVAISSGQTLANVTNVGTVGTITNPVAVTQSGDWSIDVGPIDSITTVGTITNPVAATQSGSWTVAAAQSGSWTTAATQSGTWNVGTVTAVTGITNPVTVAQSTPGNLLATVNIASAQTLATVTTVGAVTSITNPVAVTQSGTWAVGLSASQTLATVTTVGAVTSVTNPVTVAQSTAGNLLCTASIAAAQTLANVTTVGTITNAVTVSQGTASNLNATAVLAAGTALVGKVSAAQDTATIYNGTTALTPKFAKITASSSGDNSIVSLVSSKKIRVLRWSVSSNGTVAAKWRSNTTDITGRRYLIQYASAGGSYCPAGLFETASGEALQLNLSGAVSVEGELTYIEV